MEETNFVISDQGDSTLNQSSENLSEQSKDNLVIDEEGKETLKTTTTWMQVFSVCGIIFSLYVIYATIKTLIYDLEQLSSLKEYAFLQDKLPSESSLYFKYLFLVFLTCIFLFANVKCLQGAKAFIQSLVNNEKEDVRDGLNSMKIYFILMAALFIILLLLIAYSIIDNK